MHATVAAYESDAAKLERRRRRRIKAGARQRPANCHVAASEGSRGGPPPLLRRVWLGAGAWPRGHGRAEVCGPVGLWAGYEGAQVGRSHGKRTNLLGMEDHGCLFQRGGMQPQIG
jgi:hypothetical protein